MILMIHETICFFVGSRQDVMGSFHLILSSANMDAMAMILVMNILLLNLLAMMNLLLLLRLLLVKLLLMNIILVFVLVKILENCLLEALQKKHSKNTL